MSESASELTPGQMVLQGLPIEGASRSYQMSSTDKHKVSRGTVDPDHLLITVFLTASCAILGRYLTSNDPRGYM
jgi:hypothetical protein